MAVKADSNKVINKVARLRLKPLGFVRLSDRSWSYDGGWWLLHIYFGPSMSGGSYTELGVQPLVDWHSNVTLGSVEAPRRWTGFEDVPRFEADLHERVDELLPIALGLITEVASPAQMVACERIHLGGALRLGLLQALANDFTAAKKTLGSFEPRPGIEYDRVTARHAQVALNLLDDRGRFYDFIDLLILRSRLAIGGGIGSHPPMPYPWIS